MTTPKKSARNIQQKILSSKEVIRSVLSYNAYRRDDPICSDKELEKRLQNLDREFNKILEYLSRLEIKSRQDARKRNQTESDEGIKDRRR